MADSRFIVGIDLGTTNSVLAWLDSEADELDPDAPAIRVMSRSEPPAVASGS